MSVIGLFDSFDNLVLGAGHILATCKNAADSGRLNDLDGPAEITAVVEEILADSRSRNIIAMYLINLRASELFVAGTLDYNLAMSVARGEVRTLLEPNFMGKLIRGLLTRTEGFKTIFAQVKTGEPQEVINVLLQSSCLVQGTVLALELENKRKAA